MSIETLSPRWQVTRQWAERLPRLYGYYLDCYGRSLHIIGLSPERLLIAAEFDDGRYQIMDEALWRQLSPGEIELTANCAGHTKGRVTPPRTTKSSPARPRPHVTAGNSPTQTRKMRSGETGGGS